MSVHTIKENIEALVDVNKEIGLEVNADKTKYMVMSQDQNVGLSHDIEIDNTVIPRLTKIIRSGITFG